MLDKIEFAAKVMSAVLLFPCLLYSIHQLPAPMTLAIFFGLIMAIVAAIGHVQRYSKR